MKLVQLTLDTINRNIIKNEILKLYDVERSKTINLLDACESRNTITINMWIYGYYGTLYRQPMGVMNSHYEVTLLIFILCLFQF